MVILDMRPMKAPVIRHGITDEVMPHDFEVWPTFVPWKGCVVCLRVEPGHRGITQDGHQFRFRGVAGGIVGESWPSEARAVWRVELLTTDGHWLTGQCPQIKDGPWFYEMLLASSLVDGRLMQTVPLSAQWR